MSSLLRSTTLLSAALALGLAAGRTDAQNLSLNTSYAGGNGLYGAMFDLAATGGVPLRIQNFDINTAATAIWQVYVVTANTSWFGLDNTAAAWTLLATTPTIVGAGTGLHTPLNLALNYPIPGGATKVGFYVTATTSVTLTYSNGTTTNNLFANDLNLSFYEGMGKSIPQFSGGFAPRVFNGTIYYTFDSNILTINQSGPAVGDLSINIGMLSPSGAEGYMLLSTNTSGAVGAGPILGLTPDGGTFSVFGFPYYPGNPFHFNGQDIGVFPQQAFSVPPGSVSSLQGFTFDFTMFMFNGVGGYDSKSNVVRYTFI